MHASLCALYELSQDWLNALCVTSYTSLSVWFFFACSSTFSLSVYLHNDLLLFLFVLMCLSTYPVCFVSLQSADKDTVPAQLFFCLPASLVSAAPGTNLVSSFPLAQFTSLYLFPCSLIVLLLNSPR